jgi:hypothetical protein
VQRAIATSAVSALLNNRVWFRALAVAIGACAAAGLGEIAYRITRASGLGPTTNSSYVQFDEELGWSYRPNVRARHQTAEFDVAIDIHSRGFRGPEWPKDSERPRILVLGDSYAFGWGVEFEQSFSGLLQTAHPEWDVRNAAVAGYGADQQLLVLRRLRESLRPAVVVCNFCDNDLWESSADEAYGRIKPQFVLLRGDLALRASHLDSSWLFENSMLYAAVEKRMWQSRFAAGQRNRATEWQMVERLYCAMRDELQGVPFVLVSEEPQWSAFALRERGVVHVDVREALGRAGVPTRFDVDGHWNEAGHAAVAARLGEKLATALAAQSK